MRSFEAKAITPAIEEDTTAVGSCIEAEELQISGLVATTK